MTPWRSPHPLAPSVLSALALFFFVSDWRVPAAELLAGTPFVVDRVVARLTSPEVPTALLWHLFAPTTPQPLRSTRMPMTHWVYTLTHNHNCIDTSTSTKYHRHSFLPRPPTGVCAEPQPRLQPIPTDSSDSEHPPHTHGEVWGRGRRGTSRRRWRRVDATLSSLTKLFFFKAGNRPGGGVGPVGPQNLGKMQSFFHPHAWGAYKSSLSRTYTASA